MRGRPGAGCRVPGGAGLDPGPACVHSRAATWVYCAGVGEMRQREVQEGEARVCEKCAAGPGGRCDSATGEVFAYGRGSGPQTVHPVNVDASGSHKDGTQNQ